MGFSIASRNAGIDTMTAKLNGGTLEIRSGTKPASPETAATGTVLATLTLGNPAFAASSNASASANAITGDSSADASGTAGWFRAYDSLGNAVDDGTVTATGGGGEMTLNNVSIVAGGTVNVTSWAINLPAS